MNYRHQVWVLFLGLLSSPAGAAVCSSFSYTAPIACSASADLSEAGTQEACEERVLGYCVTQYSSVVADFTNECFAHCFSQGCGFSVYASTENCALGPNYIDSDGWERCSAMATGAFACQCVD